MQEIVIPIEADDDQVGIAEWEAKRLNGDDTCEVRVYANGVVMWARQDTPCGPHLGAAVVSVARDVPHTAFLNALAYEQRRPLGADDRRLTLFCGGCLVYRPTSPAPHSGLGPLDT